MCCPACLLCYIKWRCSNMLSGGDKHITNSLHVVLVPQREVFWFKESVSNKFWMIMRENMKYLSFLTENQSVQVLITQFLLWFVCWYFLQKLYDKTNSGNYHLEKQAIHKKCCFKRKQPWSNTSESLFYPLPVDTVVKRVSFRPEEPLDQLSRIINIDFAEEFTFLWRN